MVIDFDVGLRNLDLIMGCERRVVYDFVNVINGEANLNQALIRDKRCDNLYVLPASQTRDKDALSKEGVGKVLEDLGQGHDYIVCDSHSGIEHPGATMAMYYADDAVVVTNPEVSSVRDSDRMLGILSSKSRRAETSAEPIREHPLLRRYSGDRVERGEMLSVDDVQEILSLSLLGVIPESQAVLKPPTRACRSFSIMNPRPVRPMAIWSRAILATRCRCASSTAPRRGFSAASSGLIHGPARLFPRWSGWKGSAAVAKERLQILVAHDRRVIVHPNLPKLQQEILAVIREYVEVDVNAISVNYEQEEDQEILELNIVLPENAERA